MGTLHRLRAHDGTVTVLVPRQPPSGSGERPYLSHSGLGYLTFRVVDFDAVIDRVEPGGGTIIDVPRILGPESRLAIVRDPDETTIEIVEAVSE